MRLVMSVLLRTSTEASSFYSFQVGPPSSEMSVSVWSLKGARVKRIAIAGATGYIGGRPAPRLLEAGYSLRCLVRSPRKLEGRDWTSDSRVEVWPSDLDDPTSLTRDLSGCDVAFYLVHSMMSRDRAYAEHDLALSLTFD